MKSSNAVWIVSMLLVCSGCASSSSQSQGSLEDMVEDFRRHPPWEQGAPADEKTKKEILLAIGAVQSWREAHKAAFPSSRPPPPVDDWRKLGPNFFTDPNSKSVAFSAWAADHSDYWWAVRKRSDLGPWEISAPQEDGFTFVWTVGVGSNQEDTRIVEVRMVYPIDIIM